MIVAIYRHFLNCPQISKIAERWVFPTLWRETGDGTHEHCAGSWLSGRYGNDKHDGGVHQLWFKVQKMLCGKHGMRLGFLRQRSHPNLPEEEVGLRKDIAREWNHIYETVSLLITFPFLPYMFDEISLGDSSWNPRDGWCRRWPNLSKRPERVRTLKLLGNSTKFLVDHLY